VKTVDNTRTNLMRKLNLHDVASLTRYALDIGLIEPKKRSKALRRRNPLPNRFSTRSRHSSPLSYSMNNVSKKFCLILASAALVFRGCVEAHASFADQPRCSG